ncbi:hypothetical protein BU23DRAFT_511579 [Bimuria novae-zelandiae CBS 107.79]|uniref:Flavin reductase like domain-containing protein n=1 Tax=Bimuria novae-zelandiae CBS 107.79 TaxID=1447943 RepID=A0A6A5V5S7_9PLEO|nr:hypothetical protein BU23DRAFT_511579 [Bimuria novae-zelandiae CBS 107.79]
MALAVRPAGRFFAAFYQWNCSTQRTSQCRRVLRPSIPHISRPYSITRSLLQNVESASNVAAQAADQIPPDAAERKPGYTAESRVQADASIVESAIRNLMEPDGTARNRPHASIEMKSTIREFLRYVPSSVTILTVDAIQPGQKGILPVGCVISSLTTVTLDPPHISFNIKSPSRTLTAIREAGGRFRVHFLKQTPEAAKLAQEFTLGNSEEVLLKRRKKFNFALEDATSERSLDDATSESSTSPSEETGAEVAKMDARLVQECSVADHVVAIAVVESFQSRGPLAPTMMYHNGEYMRSRGVSLLSSAAKKVAIDLAGPRPALTARDIYYKYRLFPGEQERAHFVACLKDYLKQNKSFLRQGSTNAAHDEKFLFENWNMRSGIFGVNISQTIAQCRDELGLPANLSPKYENSPAVYRFHGALSPTDKRAILSHAKQLVQSDFMVLSESYRLFLSVLDVNPHENNLLASDILNPLRKEGLAAPFEPRSINELNPSLARLTLEELEQLEFHVLKLFKTMPFSEAAALIRNSPDVCKAIGATDIRYGPYITHKRGRLITDAYPEEYAAPHVDIRGHVTEEEKRVIVARMLDFMELNGQESFHTKVKLQFQHLCRNIKVHPDVSGIDIHFLTGKLRYLRETASSWDDIFEGMAAMREEVFEKHTFAMREIKDRVKAFVDVYPLHAAEWSNRDVLAAIGVHKDASVMTADSRTVPVRVLLSDIVAKALTVKLTDDNLSPEEMSAINTRLDQEAAKPPQQTESQDRWAVRRVTTFKPRRPDQSVGRRWQRPRAVHATFP